MKRDRAKDNRQMINDLYSRLDWFMNEAAPEEYSVEEVEAIKQLLVVLLRQEAEEKEQAEQSLVGFWKTVVNRKAIRMEKQRVQFGEADLADYLCEKRDEEMAKEREKLILLQKHAARRKRRVATSKGIVAAALVVVLCLGGTAGAYAHKSGPFYWFRKDKSGEDMLIAPEKMEATVIPATTYHSKDEVPEKYQQYICELDEIPAEMEFSCHEVSELPEVVKVSSLYHNKEDKVRLMFVSRVFLPGVGYYRNSNDDYVYFDSEEYEGSTIEFWGKDTEDGMEYKVSLYYNNAHYIVFGNLPLDEMKEMADIYYKSIIE